MTEVKDYYALYTVFARNGINADRTADVADFKETLDNLDDVTVRGIYDVSAMRADADIMTWMYSTSPEKLQAAVRTLRRTNMLSDTTVVFSAMGVHRPAEFAKDHVPAFARGKEPENWLVVYPFVRTHEWYLMEPQERGQMLREHGALGQEFPMVLANTTSAFALGDWEWMLALESPELIHLVDMMRHLRNSETRLYVREEVPFYTGRRITAEEVAEVIG